MNIYFKLLLSGGLFLLAALSGIILGIKGRPLSNGIIAIHKLTTLAAAIYTGIQLRNLFSLAAPLGIALLEKWNNGF